MAPQHAGADFDATTAMVREGAKWTVEHRNTEFLTLRLCGPFSRPDIETSIRFDERPAPNTGQGIQRTGEWGTSC